MGRGDKRTAKGKRFKHSFGKSRPKTGKANTAAAVVAKAAAKPAPAKKTSTKK